MTRDATLTAVLEALASPALLADEHLRPLALNTRARQLLGYEGAPRDGDTLKGLLGCGVPAVGAPAQRVSCFGMRARCTVRAIDDGAPPTRHLVTLEPLEDSPQHDDISALLAQIARRHDTLRELALAFPPYEHDPCAYVGHVARVAARELACDATTIWFRVGDEFVRAHDTTLETRLALECCPTVAISEASAFATWLDSGAMIECADVGLHRQGADLVAFCGAGREVRAILGAPIRTQSGITGALFFESRTPRQWQAPDAMFAGSISFLVTLAVQANARREMEQKLADEQSRLAHVTSAVPGVVFQYRAKDGHESFPFVAGTSEALFGFSAEAIMADGRVAFAGVLDEDLGGLQEALAHSIESLENLAVEFRVRDPRGQIRWARAQSAPERCADGAVVLNGIISDVTELKRLEESLRHAQKMEAIGQLAGGIAHDFNNLLMIINGSSELLLRTLDPAQPGYELIEAIRRSGLRGAALTRRLLSFSCKQHHRREPLDLNRIVEQTHAILPRLMGAHIECVVELGEELGCIEADPVQIEQVLLNFAVNARDAMPDGGTLSLSTSRQRTADGDEVVVLRVTDTGHGMDAATRERIFEPFFTTKPADRGTGLGLATVYGIVEQSGGQLEVESEPGAGTVFTISLPRLATPLVAPTPDAPLPAEGLEELCGALATVLLVEDEKDVRDLVRRQLATEGYRVLEARDGRDAMSVAEAHGACIDLLLTDVTMPELSGPELARRLCGTHPSLRVVFMSGYLAQRDLQQFQGATLLHKPFTSPELSRAIRRALR